MFQAYRRALEPDLTQPMYTTKQVSKISTFQLVWEVKNEPEHPKTSRFILGLITFFYLLMICNLVTEYVTFL